MGASDLFATAISDLRDVRDSGLQRVVKQSVRCHLHLHAQAPDARCAHDLVRTLKQN